MVWPEWCGGFFQLNGGGIMLMLKKMILRDYRILRVGGFASGELRIPQRIWESFSWPDTYNRSNKLEGIQDILTALVAVQKQWHDQPIILAGMGESGLLVAFAGALFGQCDQVFVDLNRTDPDYDRELLELLPVGSLKRVGDFRTAMLMLMRSRISLFNAAPTFDSNWYRDQATRLGISKNLYLHLDKKLNLLTGQM
jgi:hypothetical protein